MAKIDDLLGTLKKSHGEESVIRASEFHDTERLTTGIFALDLAFGGGFPRGKVSMVYGPESSGKTNIVLKTIAEEQRLNPTLVNVFVDLENAFDANWARQMGVDVENLAIVRPKFAEDAIDMIADIVEKDYVSIIALDSIAALAARKEVEDTAEKAVVGGNSREVSRLIKRTIALMSERNKYEHYPTLLLVNQTRTKIGVMYGDPESVPGGAALKFACSLTVRTYGKNIMVDSVSKTMPVLKKTSVVCKKHKVPISCINAEYQMAMIAHNGLAIGQVDDWNTLSTYLRDMGQLGKDEKKGWLLFGEKFPTLMAAKAALLSQPDKLAEAKDLVTQTLLAKVHGQVA